MCVPFISLPIWYNYTVHNKQWYIVIFTHTVSTIYNIVWDIYIDFGLCRHFENDEKKYLRPKITYSVWFYWYMCVSDFLLRWTWILGLYSVGG